MTTTRQRASVRLTEIQAQMYVLGEEAKSLAAFLSIAQAEDQELAAAAKEQEKQAE
ncbi:hypothetical protein [Cohnella sp. GCM10012308]|uniref:hypothetical protein n=1 Tax=Cohnella sp. GCM10012308 TaxID=3317329 RepID=UPI00361154EA